MNLENVCRTCLRVPEEPKNIFDDKNNLLSKIQTISSIQMEDTTGLPKQICNECFKNISSFYNFRKVIINSDLDLRTRLETLKKTNFTSKPRGKTRKKDVEVEDRSQDSFDVKMEAEAQNDTDTNSEEDTAQTIRALAVKKLFKCKICKKIFCSKFKLLNHKRTQHTAPGVCMICGTVVRADNLSKHIKLHSETPTKCEHCGKWFKNSESLRSHKLIHSESSFTCEICGRCFKLKAEHTRHLKKHEDPDFRKVPCTLCGKKVNELKKHMQTHTGEKPHVCEHCNKGFCSRYALKVHSRQHTNERPFSCQHCSSSFPQKVSLVTHLKSKHGIID